MILSNEQKEVFIQWLQQEIVTNENLATQAELIQMLPMAKLKRAIALSEKVVLKELTSYETQIIKSGE